jgi:hypothetical protein
MAVEGPYDDEKDGRDRDTEPIPRARDDAPPERPPDSPPDEEAADRSGHSDDETVEFPRAEPRYSTSYYDEYEDAAGTRYASTSAVGASFVVGEPLTEEELGGLRGGGGPPMVGGSRVVPLEREPSRLAQKYLFVTERFRGEWKRHWIRLAKEGAILIGATILLGLAAGYVSRSELPQELSTVLVFGWVAVFGWVGWQILDWWYDRFILTNKRVMNVSGVITRNVAMMPLARVTDMKYVQSPLGRVLNYGSFEIESAGQEQALRNVPYLPNPNDLYLRIVEEMYEPEAVEARLAGAGAAESAEDAT